MNMTILKKWVGLKIGWFQFSLISLCVTSARYCQVSLLGCLNALEHEINRIRHLISTLHTLDSIIAPQTVLRSFDATQRYNQEGE